MVVNQMGTFGKAKEWIALIILIAVLLGLAFDVAHRTWISFAGSFAILGGEICSQDGVYIKK